jgi:two-component system osmolarity sensor histidine kinase EnvZ
MRLTLRSPSLFWRTFLLILLLIATTLAAWVQSFRVFEREPRARQFAQQAISIVNITRSALLYSDPALRRELLADLIDNEGIRVLPREPGDLTVPYPDVPLVQLASREIRARLGDDTLLAQEVNGVPGHWISFTIEGDAYWVFIERDPLARDAGTAWIRWAVVAMLLSIVAAVLITRVVNRPLKRLSDAARALGAGQAPPPLPEAGPAEIREVNASFNRMVHDLSQLEQDRAVLLAGISHDLRTPLTRLRLELDINDLPEDVRRAMVGDIEQMDAIVRQFLDYARQEPQQPRGEVDLAQLVRDAVAHARLADRSDVRLTTALPETLIVNGYRTELARLLDNLLTNAARYGRDAADEHLDLSVSLSATDGQVQLVVADHGAGIAPENVDRLLRPFQRGDSARSGGTGAGLGLAIVARIAALHGGRLALGVHPPHGLRAEVTLPR